MKLLVVDADVKSKRPISPNFFNFWWGRKFARLGLSLCEALIPMREWRLIYCGAVIGRWGAFAEPELGGCGALDMPLAA